MFPSAHRHISNNIGICHFFYLFKKYHTLLLKHSAHTKCLLSAIQVLLQEYTVINKASTNINKHNNKAPHIFIDCRDVVCLRPRQPETHAPFMTRAILHLD
jgi:hypothetical protein